MIDERESDLTTLTTAETPFEAHTIVMVLNNAGIEAVAFDKAQGIFGISVVPGVKGVPVQVRSEDLEKARDALKSNISDSVDLDWDEIDVGEREDRLPLSRPGRLPLPVQIAFIFVALGVLLMIASAIIMFSNP